nr:MAG TPA: hypothetical protein [Caudoviricetes sp.]
MNRVLIKTCHLLIVLPDQFTECVKLFFRQFADVDFSEFHRIPLSVQALASAVCSWIAFERISQGSAPLS